MNRDKISGNSLGYDESDQILKWKYVQHIRKWIDGKRPDGQWHEWKMLTESAHIWEYFQSIEERSLEEVKS